MQCRTRHGSSPGRLILPRTRKPWACLFYLCGDNSLARYVEDDFREICAAGASPNVHVAIQIDRPTGAARFVLPERVRRRPPQPDMVLGNVNTGDPTQERMRSLWSGSAATASARRSSRGRVLLFNPEGRGVGKTVPKRCVHHNNLFTMPETMPFLQAGLG